VKIQVEFFWVVTCGVVVVHQLHLEGEGIMDIYPKAGDSMCLWNVGIQPQHYTEELDLGLVLPRAK